MFVMTGKTLTFEDIKKLKKPATKTVVLCMDPDLAIEYREAERTRAVTEARLELSPTDKDAKKSHLEAKVVADSLYDKVLESSISFKFKALNRLALDELFASHLPTEKQKRDAAKQGIEISYNPETLPPAIVAASLVEPALSLKEVEEMWKDDDWNQAELVALFEAAMDVNSTAGTVAIKKDLK